MILNKTPTEAWNDLEADKDTVLVDVRTSQEWQQVGYPDLSSINKEVIKVSIQNAFGEKNTNFLKQLQELNIRPEQSVYFICRSGVRSMAAAQLAYQAGFHSVVNVESGFEGDPDQNGQRGTISGWLAEKLPFSRPQ